MKIALILLAACSPSLYRLAHTEDRQHRIEIVDDGHDKTVVSVDGLPDAGHDAVAAGSLVSIGGRIAFAAKDGGGWAVWSNNNSHTGRWDGISELMFAPGGERAYFGEKQGGWYAVIGDKVSARLDALRAHSLEFSADGKHHGYAGDLHGEVRFVVDGILGPPFLAVGPLAFSADGAHAVYAGKRVDGWHVVVDGEPGPGFLAIGTIAPSPRGGHVAYTAWDGSAWRVFTDGEPGPAMDLIRRLVWRADGGQLAWLGRLTTNDVLAVDNAPVATAPQLPDRLAYAPSGALVHAEVVRGGQQLVVGDQAGPSFDEVGPPAFSPKGKLAYAARRGARWVVVVDGVEQPGGSAVGEPVWSANERLGFVARRAGRAVVVVDATPHAFDLAFEDTLAFSDDGAHWAVVAGTVKEEQLYFVVDGRFRVGIDPREVYSTGTAADPHLLHAWARAEANRADQTMKSAL